MESTKPGNLYLVPVTLGETGLTDVLPERTLTIISRLKCFIAENAKSARSFLKQVPGISPLREIEVFEIDKHTDKTDFDFYFEKIRSGTDTGLMSEAGMPGVADPGSIFVRQAYREGFKVIPLSGPSSILLALAASGLNGQGFVFHGYLPKEGEQRQSKIKLLEKNAQRLNQTQIFIETPYRNQVLYNELLQVCETGTLLSVAVDLTLATESINTMTIGQWKKRKIDLNKRPAVFLLL